MLLISFDSALTTRSYSSSNVVSTYGLPPVTRLISSDVPPTSAHSMSGTPISPPKCALATVPAAGPANTIRKGACIAVRAGTSAAEQSA